MTHRGAAALAALVVVVVGLALVRASDARALAPSEVGWWWRPQTGVGPAVPAPPFVPEGGLWVAADASGPEAVSALRVQLPTDERASVLTLHAADVRGTPSLVVCPASAAWTAASNGPWSARPEAVCGEKPVEGSVEGDIFTFDVAALVRRGVLDVVVLPGDGVFSAAFEAPGSDAMTTVVTPATAPTPVRAPSPEPAVAAAPVFGTPNAAYADTPTAAQPVLPFAAEAPTAAPVLPPSRDVMALLPSPKPISEPERTRSPLLLLVAVGVVAVWVLRTRVAVRAAASHPLATPLRHVALDRVEVIRDA